MHCKTCDYCDGDGIDGDEDGSDCHRCYGEGRLAFDEMQTTKSFESGYVKGLVTGFCIGVVGLAVICILLVKSST